MDDKMAEVVRGVPRSDRHDGCSPFHLDTRFVARVLDGFRSEAEAAAAVAVMRAEYPFEPGGAVSAHQLHLNARAGR